MDKPLAVQRRDYLANSGPSLFGISRMQKVLSPAGEMFIFLGARDGQVFLERVDKTKGSAFVELDSSELMKYKLQK